MKDKYAYHKQLKPIADKDVSFLIKKDISYGASWKRSGGRSAWFMLKRKMDRLAELMTYGGRPTTVDEAMKVDDIFEMIHSHPSGADGTVLAEVRDLRRYLLLVEAEIQQQNEWPDSGVKSSIGPGTPEDGGHHARFDDPEEGDF